MVASALVWCRPFNLTTGGVSGRVFDMPPCWQGSFDSPDFFSWWAFTLRFGIGNIVHDAYVWMSLYSRSCQLCTIIARWLGLLRRAWNCTVMYS